MKKAATQEEKISEKQLAKLQSFQTEMQKAQSEIGGIELQIQMLKEKKASVIQSVVEGQGKMQAVLSDIEEEFGKGSIDINTGSFIPYPQEQEAPEDAPQP